MVTVSNAPHHHSLRSGFGHYNTGSDKIRALRVARGTPDTTNGVKHQPPRTVSSNRVVCRPTWTAAFVFGSCLLSVAPAVSTASSPAGFHWSALAFIPLAVVALLVRWWFCVYVEDGAVINRGLGRTSRYRFARIVHVNVELSPQLYWRVVLKYRNERTEDVEDRPLGASERMVGLKSAAMRSAERIEALLVAEPSP